MSTQWYSSYEEHNYGELFYSLVRIYKPQTIVELGTKAGYSAYHMARALNKNGSGTLDCYDLWEKYPYNSVPQSVAAANVQAFSDIVHLHVQDALYVAKDYQRVDILHIDVSNDGALLQNILPQWIPKVNQLIIIEGGSPERDQVEWMQKYNKTPIAPWLQTFCSANNLEYVTIDPFPSVTLIKKI